MGFPLPGHHQKMTAKEKYDVAIIGGGLAGLSLAILLAKKGHAVVVFEKEQYPFHKVCGEYISYESWDFIESLGLDLSTLNVSQISMLEVSSPSGKLLQHTLPLGGFGVSRYKLDHALANIARQEGVTLMENTKVTDVDFNGNEFNIAANGNIFSATIACGSYGKRSNLDVKWKRSFTQASKNRLNNYVGVKYHVRSNVPVNTIALHNFSNGYCGFVKIEDEMYNLCYLTTASNLQRSGNNIRQMEATLLAKNPQLKKLWSNIEFIHETPVTISQISFDKKKQVEDHVLMTGDSAGMITPLCGNGMSMALHAAKLAGKQADLFLQGSITREKMEQEYTLEWRHQFAKRIRAGRNLQRLLVSSDLSNALIMLGKTFPKLTAYLVRQTHGASF
jgi:flavin-dependent dehydrogenase